jgi:hypothetical protein
MLPPLHACHGVFTSSSYDMNKFCFGWDRSHDIWLFRSVRDTWPIRKGAALPVTTPVLLKQENVRAAFFSAFLLLLLRLKVNYSTNVGVSFRSIYFISCPSSWLDVSNKQNIYVCMNVFNNVPRKRKIYVSFYLGSILINATAAWRAFFL